MGRFEDYTEDMPPMSNNRETCMNNNRENHYRENFYNTPRNNTRESYAISTPRENYKSSSNTRDPSSNKNQGFSNNSSTRDNFLNNTTQVLEEMQSIQPVKDNFPEDQMDFCMGLKNLNPETYIPRHMLKDERKIDDMSGNIFLKPDFDPRMSNAKASKLYELFKKQVMCDVILCTADGKVSGLEILNIFN